MSPVAEEVREALRAKISGRNWVIGVSAPAVVMGIYSSDDAVFIIDAWMRKSDYGSIFKCLVKFNDAVGNEPLASHGQKRDENPSVLLCQCRQKVFESRTDRTFMFDPLLPVLVKQRILL